jgi:penicillin-binding protein 1A
VEVDAADGTKVDQFYADRRYWVDIDDVPDPVWQAFVAAEDRRFFEHPGVDALGVARAIVTNYQAGRTVQGGSTLTQQLVKKLIVGDERSYDRKIREAVLAMRLDRELGKRGILELYMNYVPLGSGNNGVEAASRDYFGIPASQMDAGQAALLAGLVPAPSRYSPRKSMETAFERRRIVLGGMVVMGYLTEAEASEFLDDVVPLPNRETGETPIEAAYITQVRRELRELLPVDDAFSVGLQVHTALDLELQAVVVEAGQFAVDAHYERQGRRALAPPLSDVAGYLAERQEFETPVAGDCIDVVVPRTRRLDGLLYGPHVVSLQRSDWNARIRLPDPDFPSQALNITVRSGHVLSGCVTETGELALEGAPWAQSAVVVIDNPTGQVLAMSGGTDVVLEGFVRATQARRQPGSSFKPYVYATALRDGVSQLDVMSDSPISMPAGGGKLWTPKNYGGGYSGSMTLRQALARSVNTIAVRLALRVGVDEVVGVAKGLGVSTPLRRDPTIALGSSEVTPMDQAAAYATIARLGVPIQPVYITWVDGNNDEVDVVAGGSQVIGDSVLTLPGARGEPVLSPEVAYETRDMLRQVVRGGTGRSAYIAGMDRGGKTGTTNDNVDAWFVGMTLNHTIAVWVGTDGTGSLGKSETGGKAALPAWRMVADALDEPMGLAPSPSSIAWWQHGGEWVALSRGHAPTSVVNARLTPANQPLPEFVP